MPVCLSVSDPGKKQLLYSRLYKCAAVSTTTTVAAACQWLNGLLFNQPLARVCGWMGNGRERGKRAENQPTTSRQFFRGAAAAEDDDDCKGSEMNGLRRFGDSLTDWRECIAAMR